MQYSCFYNNFLLFKLSNQQASAASVQEFKIRVPKNVKKKHHVMRFNATLKVDFAKWSHVKMERENNIKEFKGAEEDMPKYLSIVYTYTYVITFLSISIRIEAI